MSTTPGIPPSNRLWPLFASLQGYGVADVKQDLAAGLTLAAIAIPEQMATARLAGFPPELGFFAFVAGALGFALFGVNRFMSVGADSTITPIFAGGLLVGAASSQNTLVMAAAFSLLVGILLIGGGLSRFGWVADLLSIPVSTGFLAGISVHIVVSQLPALLSLPAPDGSLLARIAALAATLGHANPISSALGIGVCLLIWLCERISGRIPGALLGLALATLAVFMFGLERRGVTVLPAVPAHLPDMSLPYIDFGALRHIVPLALIVTAVIMLQTAATARSFVAVPGEPTRIGRDFIGVGVGCLLSGLFGAFPVNASPPRTAIVAESGGRSQISGLTAAALVLILVTFGTSLLAYLPNAALAGVLLFVAARIFGLPTMIAVFQRAKGEFALIVITVIAIIVLPIETGVGIGIFLSLLYGVWTTTRADLIEFEKVPGTSIWWAHGSDPDHERMKGIAVVAFQAPLSFLNAYSFKKSLLDLIEQRSPGLDLVVLEASSMIAIDFTAAKILIEVIDFCRAKGVVFAIARLESLRAQQALVRFGIAQLLGGDRQFHSVAEAIQALAQKPGGVSAPRTTPRPRSAPQR